MRKKGMITGIITALIFTLAVTCFTGCGGGEKSREYVLQYTDDSGTHIITVENGMPYSLEEIPQRTGYEFLGLYDAEIGGAQYVSKNGASLAPYTDKTNKVLFPHFAAKQYTVILDYGDAEPSGVRELTATYGEKLPELPCYLNVTHKVFSGWYTQNGTQVADHAGLLPVVSVFNDKNFDITADVITLYARFDLQKYEIVFHFGTGIADERMQIEYGTPISAVVPKTRVDGNAVLSWSKVTNGEIWQGSVTENMELYAVEYAPVIELDTAGGDVIAPVVARAGTAISLPIPAKALAEFLRWESSDGNEYVPSVMPDKSITLTAVWQAKLVFDENGGSPVSDISLKAGSSIKLPVPEKDGYVFAGWYTADRTEYTATVMPAEGVALKAGWYAEKATVINFVTETNSVRVNPSQDYYWLFSGLTIDLSSILANDFMGYVDIVAHFEWYNDRATLSKQAEISMNLYNRDVISDSYVMDTFRFSNSGKYTKYSFSGKYYINRNKIYVGIKSIFHMSYSVGYIKDFYAEIAYPDTSVLYL